MWMPTGAMVITRMGLKQKKRYLDLLFAQANSRTKSCTHFLRRECINCKGTRSHVSGVEYQQQGCEVATSCTSAAFQRPQGRIQVEKENAAEQALRKAVNFSWGNKVRLT